MPGRRTKHASCCRAMESVCEYMLVSNGTVEMATTVSTDYWAKQAETNVQLTKEVQYEEGSHKSPQN